MEKVIIKQAKLISLADGYDGEIRDILIEDGRIKQIAKEINIPGISCLDMKQRYVSAGFIDSHVHCFKDACIGVDADVIGLGRGATSVIDAGSSGATNYETFKSTCIDVCETKVFTILNVSKIGLERLDELSKESYIDELALEEVVSKYKDNIVGIKARASSSVVKELGIKPIERAKEIATKVGLPLIVHVGNVPPKLEEVLNILDNNDVLTHAFHGKEGGILQDAQIINEAVLAKKRGVYFDIGHGEASFNFNVYEAAYDLGFDCDSISSDLHKNNYQSKVTSLCEVMNKLYNTRQSLIQVIDKVTMMPAQIYKLKDLGRIKVGYIGDLSVFEVRDCNKQVVDANGNARLLNKEIVQICNIYSKGKETKVYTYEK